MRICIDAWDMLDSTRPLGTRPMAVKSAPPIMVPFRGPIPWTAIEQYGRFHGFSREAVVLLAEVIAQLDVQRAERESAELKQKAGR